MEETISAAQKIREYIGLKKNEPYTFKEISDAFVKAYHSALFETIYPVLKTADNRIILEIHVKEKQRNRIGTGFSYRNGNEMNVKRGVGNEQLFSAKFQIPFQS